jgi:hypothetical protein
MIAARTVRIASRASISGHGASMQLDYFKDRA